VGGDTRPGGATELHLDTSRAEWLLLHASYSVAVPNFCAFTMGVVCTLSFAAGAMSFEDGLKLVKLRGESMQAAADAAKSGMVSVIGLNKEKVAELCEAATKEVCG